MSKYLRSGQFELIKMNIVTQSQIELELSNIYVDAVIYESIFDATMSATVSFVDTNNIFAEYALGNGEEFNIEFSTASVNESIKYSGIVYDITGPAPVNDHASGYTLHIMSKEAFTSMRTRHYEGYNTTVSNIVASVFSKIKNKKELNVSKTKFVDRFVFTGENTIPVLKMLSRYAVSSSNHGGYLFFESSKEFRFVSVKELYSQEPVKTYSYSSQPAYDKVENAHEESFDSFQDFQYEDSNKFIEEISKGMHGKTTKHLGLLEKSVEVFKFDKTKFFDKANSLGKHPFRIDTTKISHNDYIALSYNIEPRQSESQLGKNELIALHSLSTILNVGVFGDSTLRVGQICEASVPSYSSADFTPENKDMLSGNFLIAEIKHVLTPKLYNQRLMLIKDGFMETVG